MNNSDDFMETDQIEIGSPNNPGNDNDDILRRMLADLQEGTEKTSETDAVMSGAKISINSDRYRSIGSKINTPRSINTTQNSPSYTAAELAVKFGCGKKTTRMSSSSIPDKQGKREMAKEEIAAVETKRKRGRPRKKFPETTPTESLDNSSVASPESKKGYRRGHGYTDKEKELYSKPLRNGWKRELAYRNVQRKGRIADVYYVAPDGSRFRSIGALDDYLNTSRKGKVTRKHFTFRRALLGFTEIAGVETVRGTLHPELADFYGSTLVMTKSSPKTSGKPASPAIPKKKAIQVTNMQKIHKLTINGSPHERNALLKSIVANKIPAIIPSSPSSIKSGRQITSTPRNGYGSGSGQGSSILEESDVSESESIEESVVEKTKQKMSGKPASPKKKQMVQKLAMTESQRERNDFLKAIVAGKIPGMVPDNGPVLTPSTIKKDDHQIISKPQESGQGQGLSIPDKSEKDFLVATCSKNCPGDTKRMPVICIYCLRLFHKECVLAKGRVLPSLEFECSECAQFSGADGDGDEENASDETDQTVVIE